MSKKQKRKQEKIIDANFFDIDKTRLDEEWINQPKLFFTYAEQLAKARQELEEEKAELDITKAEVDKEVRDDPGNFGLNADNRITETMVTSSIAQDDRYIFQNKVVRKAKYKTDILQAAVVALEHRKSALERLVSLHGQSYFASPTPQDEPSSEAVNEYKKTAARRKKKRE